MFSDSLHRLNIRTLFGTRSASYTSRKSSKLLTKSLYVAGKSCPRKLYYSVHPQHYKTTFHDDPLMASMAETGRLVELLARLQHPRGHLIGATCPEVALRETQAWLEKHRVGKDGAELDWVLFQPAFVVEGCFARLDMLVKSGNVLEIVEVKGRGWTPDSKVLKSRRKKTASSNEAEATYNLKLAGFVRELAFQLHVLSGSLPDWPLAQLRASLLLLNKHTTLPVDALAETLNHNAAELMREWPKAPFELLCKLDLTEGAARLVQAEEFRDEVARFRQALLEDRPLPGRLDAACRTCEFRLQRPKDAPSTAHTSSSSSSSSSSSATTTATTTPTPPPPLSSSSSPPPASPPPPQDGFTQCWADRLGLAVMADGPPMIFDLWGLSSHTSNLLLNDGRALARDVRVQDLSKAGPPDPEHGLSAADRRCEQLRRLNVTTQEAHVPYVAVGALRRALATWRFPLHFIDFETHAGGLPLHAGLRPFEQLAFQYSHHLVEADGSIRHAGQYLHTLAQEQSSRANGSVLPSFALLRALRSELNCDEGTVLCYGNHEAVVLRQVAAQLAGPAGQSLPDRADLLNFIDSLLTGPAARLVDILPVLQRCYYSHYTGGANALKKVLPAILQESEVLQAKYRQPIYGQAIPSLNFGPMAWVRWATDGTVLSPYTLLEHLHEEAAARLDSPLQIGAVINGTNAMLAYAVLQNKRHSLPHAARQHLSTALLRYCELDTFAMVLLFEHWSHLCGGAVTR